MALLTQISRSNGGVPKRAVAGPVRVDAAGVEGDRHRNTHIHGGPNKAVLMIAAEVVAALAASGFPLVNGSLGENLTVGGLDVASWRTGQRYRLGEDVVIELTRLREPCVNLHVFGAGLPAALYDASCARGDVSSPRWAWGGFYARVVKPGLLIAGAPVTLESDLA